MRQTIEVGVIGSLEVRQPRARLTGPGVGSRKARALLALVALEHDRLVPIDRLVDVLWGDSPSRRPVQDAATIVSRLRGVHGADVVVGGGRTGYRLGEHVTVDLYQAGRLVAEAEAEADAGRALSLAQRALDRLDRGGVLDDWPAARWADPARRRHQALLRRARRVAATAALDIGEPGIARDTAEAALAADAFDEAACRALMCAYAATGEPVRALQAYERLRATLAVELGVHPAAPTRDLHVAILRSRPAALGVGSRRRLPQRYVAPSRLT
jgi:DNA-binding SARP family transcriptional activator